MTNIDLNNVELKNANVAATVGDKEVSVSVQDSADAEKSAQAFQKMMEQLAQNPAVSDLKVTEGNDETPSN